MTLENRTAACYAVICESIKFNASLCYESIVGCQSSKIAFRQTFAFGLCVYYTQK